jgi:hypothetical protein
MTSIIAACRVGSWDKMAKLGLSTTDRVRNAAYPRNTLNVLWGSGAYWEDQSWQVLNNCADGKA